MKNKSAAKAFTMVELLVSVAILALVSTVTYGIFSAVTKAWQRGMALSEDMQHGDFVMEQLVMGLRSTYYRDEKDSNRYAQDGFWLENQGTEDTISWVKIGPSLVGKGSDIAKGPHRVKFQIVNDPDTGEPAAAITAWSPEKYLQPEDFNPDTIPPTLLSSGIIGFECRIATNATSGELEWTDDWDLTNIVPRVVELTLYLKPLQEGERPVEMKRCVAIPVGDRFWKGVLP